ncbi:hypothetical protein AB0P21_19790 [Kribbella sp. NPDC056861]|uniref:hypothetical protein n=1 Tax=Kribbella sp. NPDC056861 TaxID=3154857 RepID=UPI0034159F09
MFRLRQLFVPLLAVAATAAVAPVATAATPLHQVKDDSYCQRSTSVIKVWTTDYREGRVPVCFAGDTKSALRLKIDEVYKVYAGRDVTVLDNYGTVFDVRAKETRDFGSYPVTLVKITLNG